MLISTTVLTTLLSVVLANSPRFEIVNSLSKRGTFNGRASFYAPGLGACGIYSKPTDYVVALNAAQYGDSGVPSPLCFNTITISYGGKSTQAQIVDYCAGCGEGGLDFSPALFEYFASESVGVFYMSWNVGGSTPTTSSYSIPVPTLPTSTWLPATSTYSSSTSSASISATSATSSISSISSSASATSSSGIASATSSSSIMNSTTTLGNSTTNSTSNGTLSLSPGTNGTAGANNLAALSQIVLGLAGLVSNAAQR